MRVKIISTFFFLFAIVTSCVSSDYTVDLGNGYFYRDEGESTKDILCEKANVGEIPATVVGYNYDEKFIIAKQKPKVPQEPMYIRQYIYKQGSNVLYYWLIIKKGNLIFGPLTIEDFNKLKIKYKVPLNIE